ncbi:MAG: cysteine protease [Bacteroidetes bacterium]|nr:MAG: cysteine protease [Bacteroidota bacterium]
MKKIFLILLSIFISFQFASGQEYGTGLNFNDKKYESVPKKAPLTRSLYTNIPSSFSLKKYTPEPKSQGQHGTCVGWSTAYAGMTILESVHKNRTDKATITSNTFSPGFIYKQIKSSSDTYCQLGSSIADALNIMKTKGVCKYDDMTEVNCPAFISPTIFSKASEYKIKDYAKIFSMFDSKEFKIHAVKKSISQKNPVIIGMNTPKSFYTAKGEWLPTESSSLTYGGHAMCIIAYDDDKYGGAFEIMNSWGTQWGNNGYLWISYENFHKFVKYAYEMIDFRTNTAENSFSLAGSIKFIKADGTESSVTFNNGIYTLDEPYKSGTLFRLYISNSAPAYVYSFGYDATKKTFMIFPYAKNISPALNYAQNDVAIPDEDHYIQTDNTIGKDYLCVLYSKNKLNIDNIKSQIENTYGSFKDRINYVLKNQLISENHIQFNQKKIAFSVKNNEKNIAVIIIETNHID